ncbi:hypothetical protein C8R46DRAFT_879117, partial [Mycena filopes]
MSIIDPIPSPIQPQPEITQKWHTLAGKVPVIPATRTVRVASLLSALKVPPETRDAMQEHADTIGYDCRRFVGSLKQQDDALQLLIQMGAHIPAEIDRDVRSKLVIRKSDHNPIAKIFTRWKRLYQCMCGSNNEVGHQASKRRDMPWKNVGCGFWIQVTTTHMSLDPKSDLLTIDEIVGDFTHSAECQTLDEMDKNPPIPLHPELRAEALSLLRLRVPLAQLKQLCRAWAQAKWGSAVGDASYRFVLNDHETTSLYRTLARERGIAQAPPQNNLDLWFRQSNPAPPDPRLTASCIAYSPCLADDPEGRFSIILCTPEQRLAAWRYGHKKQVLMDLTFGVCSGRVLLAILMAIDENNHGVPIAQIIFTARKAAKAVHADYNGQLLKELLGKYKAGMGQNAEGEDFAMEVASTDNDSRERFGIRETWACVYLLLCIFHTWQAWRNGLNKHLRVIPEGDSRQEIRRRLGKFLMRQLKEICIYDEAIAAYNVELAHFKSLAKRRDKLSKLQAKGGMAFLAYFQSYLRVRAFWESWSLAGAMEAARRMGVPLSVIARTTNHLEGFNGRLKGKFLTQHLKSGRLPRVDLWILLLITEVLPTFFAEWTEKRQRNKYYNDMR